MVKNQLSTFKWSKTLLTIDKIYLTQILIAIPVNFPDSSNLLDFKWKKTQ